MATERQILQAVHSQMEANLGKTQAEAQGQVIENARDALLLETQNKIKVMNEQNAYNNQFRKAVEMRMEHGGSAFNLQEVVNNSPYLTDLFSRMGVTNIQDTIPEMAEKTGKDPDDPDYGKSGAHPSDAIGKVRNKILADTGITPDMFDEPWKADIVNRATFLAYDPQERKWKLRYLPMIWDEANWDGLSDRKEHAEAIKGLSEALLMPPPTDAGGEQTLKSISKAKGRASGPGDSPEVIEAKRLKLLKEAYEAEKKGDAAGSLAKLRELEALEVGPNAEANRDALAAGAERDRAAGEKDISDALFTDKQREEFSKTAEGKRLLMAAEEFKAAQEGSLAAEKNLNLEQKRKFREQDRQRDIEAQKLDNALKEQKVETEKTIQDVNTSTARWRDRLPVEQSDIDKMNTEERKRYYQEQDFEFLSSHINTNHEAIINQDLSKLRELAFKPSDPKLAAVSKRVAAGQDKLYTNTKIGLMLEGLGGLETITKEELDTLDDAVGPVDNATKAFLGLFVNDEYVDIESANIDAVIESIQSFVRKDLYGATLTDNELNQWKKQAFIHGRANLKSSLRAFQNIIRNRLSTLNNGYIVAVKNYDEKRQLLLGMGKILHERALAEIAQKIASIGPDGRTFIKDEKPKKENERTVNDLTEIDLPE